jgi:hypothetical protein
MKGCDEMKRELPGEIIHPKDFSEVLAKFNIPIGRQAWWLIRWGMIIGISLLSVVCFYVALVSGEITLFQLLLGSLAVPLWMGVYVFFPVTIASVFNRLWNAGAIGPYCGDSSPPMTYQEVVSKDFRRIHSPWLQITAFLILVLFWYYQWDTLLKAWGVHSLLLLWDLNWIRLVILGLYTLIAYVAALCIVRLVLMAISLNRIFNSFTINVYPLHPDGSGGLVALRQLLWISNATLIAGLCLILSLSSRGHDHVFFIVLLFGYLILFPAILMAWLALPHREMVRARNVHLQTIVGEYNKTLQETGGSITGPTAAIAEGTERLVTLQKRHEQVKGSFPTWPVEISFASRLGLTLFLPLLTSFVPAVINLLTKIVK